MRGGHGSWCTNVKPWGAMVWCLNMGIISRGCICDMPLASSFANLLPAIWRFSGLVSISPKSCLCGSKKEGQITRSKDSGWVGSRIDPQEFFHPKKLYILAFYPWAAKCRYVTVHRCNARFGGLGVPKWWNISINTPLKTNMETKHWWLAMLVDVFPFPRAFFRFHVRFRGRYVNGDKQH